MIVDGRAIAEEVYRGLEKRRAGIARAPRLGILVVGHNPVIESFVRIKSRAAARLGVDLIRENLPEGATTDEAIATIQKLAEVSDAVIAQLPMPEIDVDLVLSAIPPEKDVDAINPTIPPQQKIVDAPVGGAVGEILERSEVDIRGKRVLIVGHGRLVGKPVEAWFEKRGIHPSVVSDSINFKRQSKSADILVLGVGEYGLVMPEDIKEGAVVIDAGTSEADGKIQGDADPACAEKCSVFTPVPGGVGPIAVAMIFKNLFDLVERGSIMKKA